MIIAKEKKRTNIAEYILYMWQIEDMIRANHFNLEEIDKNVIQQFNQPKEIKEEMRIWYEDLINRMENEGIKEKGHMQFLDSIIDELENLHNSLIRNPDELEYVNAYNKAKASINDLKTKSQGHVRGDIDACLQGLYGILMLRLQKKTLNPATKDAQEAISNLVALLNDTYMEKKGMQ